MKLWIRHWLPELLLCLLGGFFFLRELGTFPAPWSDDSLFMIVARSVAEGDGYVLPILDNHWAYPYTLAIGPALTLPVALSIWLFGFSVEAARLPMVLYLIGASLCFYSLTKHLYSRSTARWSTALLITLSTFVNTGKPVMGEVPALFFLLAGLVLLQKSTNTKAYIIGILFGISVMTKLTFGLIYPALGCAWLYALCRKDRKHLTYLTWIGIIAVATYAPWRLLEMSSATGLLKDFAFLAGTEEESSSLQIVGGNYSLFLRPQYLYYGTILFLGSIGLWLQRKTMHPSMWIIFTSIIYLCTAYFLLGPGWYRHLLLSHVLLIPSAVYTTQQIPKIIGIGILLFFIAGQGYWQLDYRGSNRSTKGAEAAVYIQEHYADTPLIIQQANIYAVLPRNDNWIFLTNPILSSRLPTHLVTPTPTQKCMGLIRGKSPEDPPEIKPFVGKYVLIEPPENC